MKMYLDLLVLRWVMRVRGRTSDSQSGGPSHWRGGGGSERNRETDSLSFLGTLSDPTYILRVSSSVTEWGFYMGSYHSLAGGFDSGHRPSEVFTTEFIGVFVGFSFWASVFWQAKPLKS